MLTISCIVWLNTLKFEITSTCHFQRWPCRPWRRLHFNWMDVGWLLWPPSPPPTPTPLKWWGHGMLSDHSRDRSALTRLIHPPGHHGESNVLIKPRKSAQGPGCSFASLTASMSVLIHRNTSIKCRLSLMKLIIGAWGPLVFLCKNQCVVMMSHFYFSNYLNPHYIWLIYISLFILLTWQNINITWW